MLFEKVDSVLLLNYRSNFNPLFNKYLEDSSKKFEGILIIKKGKKNSEKKIFISHPFNYAQAKKEYANKNTEVKTYFKRKEIQNLLKKNCGKKIGYYSEHVTVGQLKRLKNILKGKKFFDISRELEKSREIKNKEEIKKISIAVKNTKKIVGKVKKKIRKGVSEKEIALFVKREFENMRMEETFCNISFGKNTKDLHHNPTEKKLLKNEEVLIDIGGRYKGYCSDISESFWFGEKKGKKYEEYKKEFEKVKNTLKQIEKMIRPGLKASEIWEETEKNIKIDHAIGHGIGLREHDFPNAIGKESKWLLKEGMVLAIEPGSYKKFGIRIERNYLITKNGFKEL